MVAYRREDKVTCELTACTPGSAPGPTLGNEYGKTLSFCLYQNARGVARIFLGGINFPQLKEYLQSLSSNLLCKVLRHLATVYVSITQRDSSSTEHTALKTTRKYCQKENKERNFRWLLLGVYPPPYAPAKPMRSLDSEQKQITWHLYSSSGNWSSVRDDALCSSNVACRPEVCRYQKFASADNTLLQIIYTQQSVHASSNLQATS